MRRIIRSGFISLFFTFIFLSPATAFAEDEDAKNLGNVIVSGNQDTTDDTTEIQTLFDEMLDTASLITEKISSVYADETLWTQENLTLLRSSYNELPMSARVKVENINLLDEMEEKAGVTYEETSFDDTDTVTDADTKVGTTFRFEVTDDSHATSVSCAYVSNLGSGTVSSPTFTLIGPSGQQVQLDKDTGALSLSYADILITWEETFAQFDISNADAGVWTVSSSETVSFTHLEYAVVETETTNEKQNDLTSFEDTDMSEFTEENEGAKSAQAHINVTAIISSLLPLGIVVFGLIVGIIMLKRFFSTGSLVKRNDKDAKQNDCHDSGALREDEREEMLQCLKSFSNQYKDTKADVCPNDDMEKRNTDNQKYDMSEDDDEEEIEYEYPSEELSTAINKGNLPSDYRNEMFDDFQCATDNNTDINPKESYDEASVSNNSEAQKGAVNGNDTVWDPFYGGF